MKKILFVVLVIFTLNCKIEKEHLVTLFTDRATIVYEADSKEEVIELKTANQDCLDVLAGGLWFEEKEWANKKNLVYLYRENSYLFFEIAIVKVCPVCGNKATLRKDNDLDGEWKHKYKIFCRKCNGFEVKEGNDYDAVIKNWNRMCVQEDQNKKRLAYELVELNKK